MLMLAMGMVEKMGLINKAVIDLQLAKKERLANMATIDMGLAKMSGKQMRHLYHDYSYRSKEDRWIYNNGKKMKELGLLVVNIKINMKYELKFRVNI